MQKLPEELPVEAGIHDTGFGAGRRGLFCLTQRHKAEAGAFAQHHGAQEGSPHPAPGRGASARSWGRSREAGPEPAPQLGHGPEEVGAVLAVRVPAGRESHRWRPATTVLPLNNTPAEPWADLAGQQYFFFRQARHCLSQAILEQSQFLRQTHICKEAEE